MGKFSFTNFLVYRFRYIAGFGLVAIGLIGALIFSGLYLPGGLSTQEIQASMQSSAIGAHSFDASYIINLPYYLLQKMSFIIFGVSLLSIKLPSILLALVSTLGLVLLLKQWFRPNVAVLASLIAITTGQFLFIAQNGTPDILYMFWPVWMMLLVSLISSQKKYRMLLSTLFCIIAALSLYTPLSLYVLVIFALAMVIHPHLRFLIKKLPKRKLVPGIISAITIITPLIVYLIQDPKLILTLLGIPSSWPNLSENLNSLYQQFFAFSEPGGTTMITPFFELGSALIIIIGIWRVIQTKSTAKSYTIGLWALCLIPIIILSPSYTNITFLPLVILLASGVSWLLSYWYSLFPFNPYARIAGLIPVIILVSTLVFSGVNRYMFSYLYDPDIVSNFSSDISLIPSNTEYIVTTDEQLPFYKTIEKYNGDFIVSTTIPDSDLFLATRDARSAYDGYEIDKIITTSLSSNSDRFYLYKKTVN